MVYFRENGFGRDSWRFGKFLDICRKFRVSRFWSVIWRGVGWVSIGYIFCNLRFFIRDGEGKSEVF